MPMKNPVHPGALAKANLGELNLSVAEAAKTMKIVIRPNHVSGLSRINVLQCRKRCTGQQKGFPFSPFRIV